MESTSTVKRIGKRMRHGGRLLIERYLWRAIWPYMLLSALLLTAILFAQQTTRIAELLVTTGVPLKVVLDVLGAVLPSILIFVIPMAALAGIVIGFSQLSGDSELVAMRAAGIGPWRLIWPVLLLGGALTLATLYLNFEAAPKAARVWREATLRAALYKMDSPVEPRTFTTEIPGYVLYVRDGDREQGRWGRVFLYSQPKDGGRRLVTARQGRIDTSAEQSELVLSDAVVTTLPPSETAREGAYVTERLAQVRVVLETGRKALLERLRNEPEEPEGMSWDALAAYAETQEGTKRLEALTLRQKRLTFGFAPLVFSLLGVAVGLRLRKGGRGLGFVLSLALMLSYYLLSLAGEGMARAGTISVGLGAWLATGVTIGGALLLLKLKHRSLFVRIGWRGEQARLGSDNETRRAQSPSVTKARRAQHQLLLSFPGLLDRGILRSLTLSFLAALLSLILVFQIFTLLELWRFIATNNEAGAKTVAGYLFFLLPYIIVQLAPSSLLLAILTVYALMSRRSEATAWWACGQSTYRLMMPGLLLAIFIGGGLWLLQERVMPVANRKQDALRGLIRSGVSRASTSLGRQWLAANETGRLYAYDFGEEESATLSEPTIYQFDAEGVHLAKIINGQQGRWIGLERMEVTPAEIVSLQGAQVVSERAEIYLVESVSPVEVFKPGLDKPSQLSAKELSAYIKKLKRSGGETAALSVALQRKYAEPLSAIVMALIGIPLALSFGRRSALTALASAVLISLGYWATVGGTQQLGSNQLLPPAVSAWSPTIIFMAAGVYLLSRTRT